MNNPYDGLSGFDEEGHDTITPLPGEKEPASVRFEDPGDSKMEVTTQGFQGFLWKQDSELSQAYTVRHAQHWRRRWVVLEKDSLKYYRVTSQTIKQPVWNVFSSTKNKKDKKKQVKLDHLLGVVKLNGCKIHDGSDSSNAPLPPDKRQHLFYITSQERDIWFAAESFDIKMQWIGALKKLTGRAPAPRHKRGKSRWTKFPWEISFKYLSLDQKIGEGTFGEVYRGEMWGTEVAIKKLKTEGLEFDEQVIEDLKKEAQIMQSLRHPNVVLYMGVCPAPDVCIVTEFCSRGSLFDILHSHEVIMDFTTMMKIAIGVARGMNYLHRLDRKIIHRDLKSQNVLISQDWTPKICDFGISHVRQKARVATLRSIRSGKYSHKSVKTSKGHYGVYGTPEWMAPEVMEGLAYNETADVYSFGIVLCELLSRQLPFRDRYNINGFQDIIDCVLEDGAIPTIAPWAGGTLRTIIEWCLDRAPQDRPAFSQIVDFLSKFMNEDPGSWFQRFDVPRLRMMMKSQHTTENLLACREIGEIVATKDPKKQFENDDLNWFVDQLTKLLAFPNPYVQVDAVESLLSVVKNPNDNFEATREIILQGGAFPNLLQLVKMYKPAADNEDPLAQRLVNHCNSLLSLLAQNVTQDKSINEFLDISADEDGLEDLETFQTIIHEHINKLVNQRQNVEKRFEILEHLRLAASDLTDKVRHVVETEKAERKEAQKYRKAMVDVQNQLLQNTQVSTADPAPAPEKPPLLEIPELPQAPEVFEEFFGTYKTSKSSHALQWNYESEAWDPCFLYLFGAELRVYGSKDDEPDEPLHVFYTLRNGEPLKCRKCGEKFDKPFCFQIQSEFETIEFYTFCVRSRADLDDWLDMIKMQSLPKYKTA